MQKFASVSNKYKMFCLKENEMKASKIDKNIQQTFLKFHKSLKSQEQFIFISVFKLMNGRES